MRPLYECLLGDSFQRLPAVVQAMHRVEVGRPRQAHGSAHIDRGTSLLAQLCCFFLRLPKAGSNLPLAVNLATNGERETWSRHFGKEVFESFQYLKTDRSALWEQTGPLHLAFQVSASASGLSLRLKKALFFGLALPHFVRPSITAEERALEDGSFGFSVHVSLPSGALIIAYHGALRIAGARRF